MQHAILDDAVWRDTPIIELRGLLGHHFLSLPICNYYFSALSSDLAQVAAHAANYEAIQGLCAFVSCLVSIVSAGEMC